jgi:hypothetical protein
MGRRPLSDPVTGDIKQLSISIPVDECSYLEGMSCRWGIPVSSLVRIAIRMADPVFMEIERMLLGAGDVAQQYVKSRLETNANLAASPEIKVSIDRLITNIQDRNASFTNKVALAQKKAAKRAELAKTLTPHQIAEHLATATEGKPVPDIIEDPNTNPELANVDVSDVLNQPEPAAATATPDSENIEQKQDMSIDDILGIS